MGWINNFILFSALVYHFLLLGGEFYVFHMECPMALTSGIRYMAMQKLFMAASKLLSIELLKCFILKLWLITQEVEIPLTKTTKQS